MELLGKAATPAFWQEVRKKDCYKCFREELFSLWEKNCTGALPALPYSAFTDYRKNGDRSSYEGPYFHRRRALNASALLSLIYPEEERYLSKLSDVLFDICNEYTWCVPAHQGEFDRLCPDRIDLFASETGFALSEIDALMGDRLEPLIRARIRAEVTRRIIMPFTAVESYGWWETGTNNWTAVCICSVAGAIFYLEPALGLRLIPRFEAAMECYLSGFREDGICLEGCGYWHYGFGFFTVWADMLRRVTDRERDWFRRPKVQRIAAFLQSMFLSGQSSVSFADGGRSIEYHLGLLHYLKREYPEEVRVYSPEYSYACDGCARWCLHLRGALWLDEDIYAHPADDTLPAETYAPDSQWLVKRTASYGFAAKGGNNAEHHNHNDIGSFLFAKNGRQLLVDLGAGRYNRDYFGARRYEILECSSRGHSLPIVGESLQKAGAEYAASAVTYAPGCFSLDLAGAYGLPALRSLLRRFECTETAVTLTDHFDCDPSLPITERFVTLTEPTAEAGLVRVGEATLRFDPALPVGISSQPCRAGTVYFIDISLAPATLSFTATVE